MTCTTYKIHRWEDKFHPGNDWEDPKVMRPGCWDYSEHKRCELRDRLEWKNVRSRIDQEAPNLHYLEHINIYKMRHHERERQRIEKENRFMANRISLVWQTKGGVDHINDLRYVHSLRKECAIIKAKEDVKKNIKLMQYVHKCGQKSEYDRQKAFDDYDKMHSKMKPSRKFDPVIWDPVFEKRYQKEVKRGRALDPNYKWRF